MLRFIPQNYNINRIYRMATEGIEHWSADNGYVTATGFWQQQTIGLLISCRYAAYLHRLPDFKTKFVNY